MAHVGLTFSDHGPFDAEERAVICEVVAAVARQQRPHAEDLVERVRLEIGRLDRVGEALSGYPSIFEPQRLGERRRDLATLVDNLTFSNLSNFEMFLPTRALLGRNLVLGEVNFYRLLRLVCEDGLSPAVALELRGKVDRLLCVCLYTRLAEEVLVHIASARDIDWETREKAVLSLAHIWQRATYRITDVFPVLQATWEARRRVPCTLGTLMGVSEMFRLLQAGCDERFVDYLTNDGSEEHAAALREFLFGATTEQLKQIDDHRAAGDSVSVTEAGEVAHVADAAALEGDPALAMYEFFLSRHLQAAARRQADLPGPKRTAEEYVLLRFLRDRCLDEGLSSPGPERSAGS